MLRNKNNQNHIKRQFGFTLIELLVVMFIISLLATLTLVHYRNSQKRYILEYAAQQIVSDIRKSQNMAMSGVDISGQYYGYGIYAEKGDNSYIIYADENDSSSFQSSEVVIETISLSDKIEIESVSPLSNEVDIFFKSPDPTTYINESDTVGALGTITLGIKDTSLTKTVTITTAGLIQAD